MNNLKNWFSKLPQTVRMFLVLVLYLCIFVVHVAGVNLYVEKYSSKVDSKEVVVTTREIPIHTVIGPDDITIKRVRLAYLVSGAITDPAIVIGKESQATLGENEQLNADKINTVVKKEGEMIFEVPSEWVVSFPKSLRRLDKVSFLPVVDSTKNAKTALSAIYQQEISQTASEIAKDERNASLVKEAREVLNDITVAYFKDNTANEITDTLPANSTITSDPTPRINSSNLGVHLEVAMNDQQWDILNKLSENNYKFVISYK
jgi:hypothetical protein